MERELTNEELKDVNGGGILVDPLGGYEKSWTPGYLVKTKNVETSTEYVADNATLSPKEILIHNPGNIEIKNVELGG